MGRVSEALEDSTADRVDRVVQGEDRAELAAPTARPGSLPPSQTRNKFARCVLPHVIYPVRPSPFAGQGFCLLFHLFELPLAGIYNNKFGYPVRGSP